MEKKSNCCCRQAQCSGEKHDWCERTTVKCGAFHQCADGLEVFFGPFRFHMFTLQSKAKISKRKGCFGMTLGHQCAKQHLILRALASLWLFCFRLETAKKNAAPGAGPTFQSSARARAMARRRSRAAGKDARHACPHRRRSAAETDEGHAHRSAPRRG